MYMIGTHDVAVSHTNGVCIHDSHYIVGGIMASVSGNGFRNQSPNRFEHRTGTTAASGLDG